MYFFTPNIQFMANPLFALGNYFGNCLSNSLMGGNFGIFGGFNQMGNFNYVTPPDFSASIFSGTNYINDFSAPDFTSVNYFQNINFNNNFNNFAFGNNFEIKKTKETKEIYKDGLKGYNAEKGKRLANDALKHAVGFTEHCAKYVSDALERTGLNTNMNRAHGYYLTYEFRKNPNFKEVSVSSVDWKNLPAGCILLYKPRSQGYHIKYGHVEISTGNKTAVSDGVTHNIRKPDVIFIPV